MPVAPRKSTWDAWYAKTGAKKPSGKHRYSPAGFRQKYAATLRRSHLNRKFGMALEQYDAMLRAQHGFCAICQLPETKRGRSGAVLRLHVDHDHATGTIRGLLCRDCNIMLGIARDSTIRLEAAADYLRRHGSTPKPLPQPCPSDERDYLPLFDAQ